MSDVAGLVVLVGRLVFAIQFLVGAVAHFRMREQMVGYARSMKVPAASLGGWPAGVWLLAASLSVVLGVWPDIGALMIALWGVPTAFLIHSWWRYDDPDARQNQQLLFFRNLAFVGAGIALFGVFVTLGDQLRFALTPALLNF